MRSQNDRESRGVCLFVYVLFEHQYNITHHRIFHNIGGLIQLAYKSDLEGSNFL